MKVFAKSGNAINNWLLFLLLMTVAAVVAIANEVDATEAKVKNNAELAIEDTVDASARSLYESG